MKVLIRNLNNYNEKNVALELEVEQSTNLVKELLNIKNKIDKSDEAEAQHRTFHRKKRKPPVFNRYEPPQTIKINEQISIRTHEIDWNYINQVEVVSFTLDRFVKVAPDADLKKTFVIKLKHNDKVVVFANSKEEVVQAIKIAVAKYVDNEEFYSERIQNWRKKYVEAETQGVEALEKFKINNSRPQYGENTFKVGNDTLNVSDFIDIKKNWLERSLFNNPYIFPDSRFNISPFNFQPEKQDQNSSNEIFRKIENERFDFLRKDLNELNIKIQSADEFLNEKYETYHKIFQGIRVQSEVKKNEVA